MKKKSLGKEMMKHWRLYCFLLLPLLYLIVFKYIPIMGMQIAFRDYTPRKGIWLSNWVGFKYFIKFFKSYYFVRVIKNTVLLSFYTLLVGFPFPIILALTINAIKSKRYQGFIQNITYMPHFISAVVMVGIMFQIFNTHSGIFASIWTMFSNHDVPNVMESANSFPHMYVWSALWQNCGWNSIIYIAALASVDPQQHEAALLDGATRFQRVIHIDLPAIIPTIVITLILACGTIMNIGFDKVFLMQNNLNLSTSEVISTYVYKTAFGSGGNFSFAAAIDVFNSVFNFILIVVVNKISKLITGGSLW